MNGPTRRSPARLVASVATLALLTVAVPIGLQWVARRRFGGRAPWAGIDPPTHWDPARIRDALTQRMSESMIVDLVLRIALVVVWTALAVLVVTIAVETVHMARHGGLAMPTVRGLGWSQRIARAVAVGLLVVLPATHASRTPVGAAPRALPATAALLAQVDPPHAPPAPGAGGQGLAWTANATYTVQPGDSVYAIASHLVGADSARTAAIADQILDLNLGTEMPDGRRFTNAAYIEPGWVLTLPAATSAAAVDAASPPGEIGPDHVVEPGETLWSIAEDELGDPTRWPEIWAANEGDVMGTGRVFDDPDLILPGWRLDVPSVSPPAPPGAGEPVAASSPSPPAPPTAEPEPVPVAASPVAVAPVTTTVPVTVPVTLTSMPVLPAPPAPAVRPAPTAATVLPAPGIPDAPRPDGEHRSFGLEHAAMLSAGLLTLVGVRRVRRLRAARPRARVPAPRPAPLAIERALRTVGAGERLLRVDIAIRAAAAVLSDHDRRILAALVDDSGAVELITSGSCAASAPFTAAGDRWHLAATIDTESLGPAARSVGAPCLSLVQLGNTPDGRDVYVDIEALVTFSVDAERDRAEAVVTAIAATLGSSVLAETAHLVGVGLDPAAFVGHRHHTGCESFDAALDLATSLIGSTAVADQPTFALRARMVGGEAWEPAIVLVAADHVDDTSRSLPAASIPGLAVVAAGRLAGTAHALVDHGRCWRLEPLGIELVPIGLAAADLAAVAQLVDDAAAPLELDAGEHHAVADRAPVAAAPWSLLVRLLGPVDVVDDDGEPIVLERSKTRELIAWLATHRERSTRTLARTAMWELDVRDATFSNVVSEARRAMARLVEPPPGEEWLARTLTDELPLHARVRTDVELVEHFLAVARGLPPERAIDVLRPAVELIRGMPFEGTGYLWPDAEGITSNLVLLATSAALELAGHHLALGATDGVFWATGQGLRVLPGHEDLIAMRMRAHAGAGDLAGVRSEWQCYERVIAADPWSDGEPSPKLVDLRRELLAAPAPRRE